MTGIKNFIFIFSLVANMLFFCMSSLVGSTFEGSESSPIYKLFMAGVGGMVIAMTFYDLLQGKIRTTLSFWVLLVLLPIFVIGSYYIETGAYIINKENASLYLLYMLCFSYTACCSGIYVAHLGIGKFAKYLDVIMLIITMSFFGAIVSSIGGPASVGGTNYQLMSYMGAFAFNINMCMILWGNRYERFKLFRGEKWNMVAYGLLVVQLLTCLISGGRGGFLVIVTGSVYMLYRSKKLGRALTLGVFALIVSMAAGKFSDSDLAMRLQQSTMRTFNYMGGDSEQMKKVSGRSTVYEEAIEHIKEDNYMGRGLFRCINEGYPHNFILEVMVQGGIIYLVFWLVMLIILIMKGNQLVVNQEAYILIPFTIYPFIQLLFSGTYITTPQFWFVISYTWTRCSIT